MLNGLVMTQVSLFVHVDNSWFQRGSVGWGACVACPWPPPDGVIIPLLPSAPSYPMGHHTAHFTPHHGASAEARASLYSRVGSRGAPWPCQSPSSSLQSCHLASNPILTSSHLPTTFRWELYTSSATSHPRALKWSGTNC